MGYSVVFGEPTIAGAILDRIIHNAHRIAVQGDSMRRKNGTRPLTDVENSETNINNQATKSQPRHAARD